MYMNNSYHYFAWRWTWALGVVTASMCGVVGGGELAARMVLWQDDCHDPKAWQVTCHRDGQVVTKQTRRPALTRVVLPDGRAALRLAYRFPTRGHDAMLLTQRGLSVSGAARLELEVEGDGSGHRLFAVLTEASGEQHLVQPAQPINWKGLRTIFFDVASLRRTPKPHAVEPYHWGGDGNQKLDDPIIAVTIGIDDQPDTFVGDGCLHLGAVRLLAADAAAGNTASEGRGK